MRENALANIKLIIIDPASKNVFQQEVPNSLRAMQGIVGGSIETVVSFPKNDHIYANANGMFAKQHYWWTLRDQPIVFTGAAFAIKLNRFGKYVEPSISCETLRRVVEFLSKDEARVKWDSYQAARRAKAAAYTGDARVFFVESRFPE